MVVAKATTVVKAAAMAARKTMAVLAIAKTVVTLDRLNGSGGVGPV